MVRNFETVIYIKILNLRLFIQNMTASVFLTCCLLRQHAPLVCYSYIAW